LKKEEEGKGKNLFVYFPLSVDAALTDFRKGTERRRKEEKPSPPTSYLSWCHVRAKLRKVENRKKKKKKTTSTLILVVRSKKKRRRRKKLFRFLQPVGAPARVHVQRQGEEKGKRELISTTRRRAWRGTQKGRREKKNNVLLQGRP